jgi:hypothetical protein
VVVNQLKYLNCLNLNYISVWHLLFRYLSAATELMAAEEVSWWLYYLLLLQPTAYADYSMQH